MIDADRLTHYIVVRRDLPLGVIAAQVTHAAGESFYLLASYSGGSMAASQEAGGERPPTRANSRDDIPRATAVVLGARNESKLLSLERLLADHCVPHIAVREPDEPWNGQLMAIGLVPGPRGLLCRWVSDFDLLREEAA